MSTPRAGSAPEVCVVIPTRNRDTRLTFALDALAEQTLSRDRFEVIVVRDRPAEGLGLQPPPGLLLRVIELDHDAEPSRKRNIGWRASDARLIAFTDDDCRPAPDWLESLLAIWDRHERHSDVFLQGRTEPDPDEEHLLHRLARSQTIRESTPTFQCCNIAYPRSLLDRLGGFDEEYAFGGEDTDLGLRAQEAGARRFFVSEPLVWHAVHTRGLGEAIRDGLSWQSIPLMVRRHPQLREALVHRYFWKEAHEGLLLAAAGVALAPRTRGLSLIAAAPYVKWYWNPRINRVTPRRLAGFAVFLAERAVVDAAEVAATARSAIRYRTPLL
ncbi:MAG: glycosyltransferase family 2 protein [Solirubrobacterales bacterium]